MATYDLTKGGVTHDWPNRMYAELPSREVGPYEFMEAAAHFRPTQLTINRYMWFGNRDYYAGMNHEATHSPSLAQFLRNLYAEGKTITTADKLKIITLPIDHVVERIFLRNMRAMPGWEIKLTIEDKDGDVMFDVGTFDLSLPHLDRNPTTGAYSEHFIQPIWVPSLPAGQQAELDAQTAAQIAAVTEQLDAANARLAQAQALQTSVTTAGSAADGPSGAVVTAEEQAAIDDAAAAVDEAQAQVDALWAELGALNAIPADPVAPAVSAYGMYLGHNHELVLQFTKMPEAAAQPPVNGQNLSCLGDEPCLADFKMIFAAQLNNPWLGAW